jgi:hypothetical protein
LELFYWQTCLIFNTPFSIFFILINLQTVDISLDFRELIHTIKVCNINARKTCLSLVK